MANVLSSDGMIKDKLPEVSRKQHWPCRSWQLQHTILITTQISIHLNQREKCDNLCITACFRDGHTKCICEDSKLWGNHRIHMTDKTPILISFYLITGSYMSLWYVTNYINTIFAVPSSTFCSI
jgi:hypothetical protein